MSPVTHHTVVGVVQVLLTKRPAVVALPAPFREVVTVLTRVSELVKVVTNEPRQSGLAPTTTQSKDAVTPFPNGDLQPPCGTRQRSRRTITGLEFAVFVPKYT